MRHAVHWHLLGSAALAWLIGILTNVPAERTFVIFILVAAIPSSPWDWRGTWVWRHWFGPCTEAGGTWDRAYWFCSAIASSRGGWDDSASGGSNAGKTSQMNDEWRLLPLPVELTPPYQCQAKHAVSYIGHTGYEPLWRNAEEIFCLHRCR